MDKDLRLDDIFRELEPDLQQEIKATAIRCEFKSGEHLVFEGDTCTNFLIVESGRVRVYKIGESGREVTLYHLQKKETCILTAFGILSRTPFLANAVVEESCKLVLIPAEHVRDWINRSRFLRDFVFQSLSTRLNDVMSILEAIAFQRVDARVAGFLLGQEAMVIEMTHDKIAREVGSSRVVISRILEHLENEGVVKLARGRVEIVDEKNLRKLTVT